MSRAFRLLAISLLVLCALFPSTYGLENITVVSPPELQYLNPLFDSPAMFGIPSYQTAVSGRLIYVEPYDGCSPFNANFAENDAVILLIDRGTCHFTTKVLNAQLIGSPVKAVIVADNTVEYFPPMMQDDGLGSRITIPSVMIRKAAADSLKTANLSVSAPTPVLMQMEWRVPRPDNIVTWELWTSSNNPATRELISTFGSVMDALGDRVQFTPYYYTLPGTGYDDPNMRGSLSGDLCTNNNRYCTDSPVPATSGGRSIMSGFPVVQLNVLHVCLWRYLVSQNQQRLWWSVMNEWNNVVFETAGSFDQAHLFAAMTQYSIPVKPITDCLAASGGISSSSTTQNTIAVDMINNATQRRVIMPAVYANGDVYRGSFSCPSPPSLDSCGVLQYICNNFRQDSSLPSACAKTGCPIGQVKDNCGVCNGKNLCQETPASSGVKTEAVVGVIIVIVFVLVAGGVYWNRRHQQQMRSDLDNILATYVRIDENGQARRPTEKNLPLSIHQDRSREGDDQATDNIRLL